MLTHQLSFLSYLYASALGDEACDAARYDQVLHLILRVMDLKALYAVIADGPYLFVPENDEAETREMIIG